MKIPVTLGRSVPLCPAGMKEPYRKYLHPEEDYPHHDPLKKTIRIAGEPEQISENNYTIADSVQFLFIEKMRENPVYG